MKKVFWLVVVGIFMISATASVYAADEYLDGTGWVFDHRWADDPEANDTNETRAKTGSYTAPIVDGLDTDIYLDRYGYVDSYKNNTVYSKNGETFLVTGLDEDTIGIGLYVINSYTTTEEAEGDWNIIYFMHTKRETASADAWLKSGSIQFGTKGDYLVDVDGGPAFGKSSGTLVYIPVMEVWKLSDHDDDINTLLMYNDNVMLGIHRAYWETHDEKGVFIALRKPANSLTVSDIDGQYGFKIMTHVVEEVVGEDEVEVFEGMIYFDGNGAYTVYPFGVETGITGTYSIDVNNQLVISGYGKANVAADFNTIAMEVTADSGKVGLSIFTKVSDNTEFSEGVDTVGTSNDSSGKSSSSSGGGCFIGVFEGVY